MVPALQGDVCGFVAGKPANGGVKDGRKAEAAEREGVRESGNNSPGRTVKMGGRPISGGVSSEPHADAHRLRSSRRSAPYRERRCSPQSKGLRRGSTRPLSIAAFGRAQNAANPNAALASQRLHVPIESPRGLTHSTSFRRHGAPRLIESGDSRRSPRALAGSGAASQGRRVALRAVLPDRAVETVDLDTDEVIWRSAGLGIVFLIDQREEDVLAAREKFAAEVGGPVA